MGQPCPDCGYDEDKPVIACTRMHGWRALNIVTVMDNGEDWSHMAKVFTDEEWAKHLAADVDLAYRAMEQMEQDQKYYDALAEIKKLNEALDANVWRQENIELRKQIKNMKTELVLKDSPDV